LSLFKEYFSYSKGERNGILILLFILVGLIVFYFFVEKLAPKEQTDFSQFKKEIDEFLASQEYTEPESSQSYETKQIRSKYSSSEKPVSIDINKADSAELRKIKGVGAVFSARIVKYRNILGGFVKTEQLIEVYGIDPERYEQIKLQVFVKNPGLRKINLNTANFYQLKRHPYFSKAIANAILNHRKEKGLFEKVDSLKSVDLITSDLYEKIHPYLMID